MTDILRRGRLGATDDEVAEFLSSFASDRRIFEADIDVGRAHVVMLAEQGIVSDDDAGVILDALDEVEEDGFDALDDTHEDVHPAIEAAVVERVGEDVGGRLHTARSRNDEVSTCIRVALREELLGAMSDVLALRSALVERAEETDDWLVSGYTHLQRAQPTTVGHYLLSYDAVLERDFARLADAYDRLNECPLGSAAFAGTSFDIDRERVASLLGFDVPTRNSTDGVASRDFAVESVAVALNLSVTLSRLCEDLVLWSSHEFGLVEFDDAYSSTSSIMPQKKNPDTAELARGKTATVQGALNGIASNLKGLPSAYNRDLQEATGHVWDAFDAARSSTRVLAGVVETAEFDRDAAEETVRDGFVGATELADTLVRETGIAFRTAHHIVATVARETDDEPTAEDVRAAFEDVTDDTLELDDETVENALDPRGCVESHDSYGAPGDGTLVEKARAALERDMDTLNRVEEDLELSEERLEEAVEETKT
ncbi:MAG: argininosuccinate lyase [Halobacteriales archaeon]|nr:argininosuccinate lyase [Halobacteriales archaeon]